MANPGAYKLFNIRGGVHPEDHKALTADKNIQDLPMPPLLHVPMQQHIGAPARHLVHRGQLVKKGQLLARSEGDISAPIHAPTSGRIMGIGGYPAHHASGLTVRTVTLQPDGKDEWHESIAPEPNPLSLTPDEIIARIKAAGIVGMGGATFPSGAKLHFSRRYKLHTLVINGAECEPYVTCDDRLMRERPTEILGGVQLMARALGVGRALIGIENNKPQAQAALRKSAATLNDLTVEIVGLPARYPMGSAKQLVQALTGKETPARGRTADLGVVVHNIGTTLAVYEALFLGRPMIARVMTVSGGAIRRPRNLLVPLGTPLSHLVDCCGGLKCKPAKLISGGPMMGQPLPSLRVPAVKGSNSLLALSEEEVELHPEMPCIRCASCVSACPVGLLPVEMVSQIRAGNLENSVKIGLLDCIACGSCSYVCPSHIPLIQYFNFAKGELTARQRAQHKQGETRRLAEARTARMEAIKRAKREMMLKRKREKQAQKQLETQPPAIDKANPANAAETVTTL
jgi:electron transport complex protein RnfC